MYIPKMFQETDSEEILAFMKHYSFATIVSSDQNIPIATHLPFSISHKDGAIVLSSHLAKANPHSLLLAQNRSLVIFSEPHAYISPSHYDSKLSVPTWNYISVHAYGLAKVLENNDDALIALETMIDSYDQSYRKQWDGLPIDYKLKMVAGIVAFEITVDELQASKKLSQNKTATEQERIIETLSNSNLSSENAIGDYMRKNKRD